MHPRLLVVGAACAALIASSGGPRAAPARPAPATYGTPAGVFAAAQKALKAKDYKAYHACLSPESADVEVGKLIFNAIRYKELSRKIADPAGRRKAAERAEAIEPALRKHGVTQAAIDKVMPTGGSFSGDKLRALMRQLAAIVKDRPAFYAEMMAAEERHRAALGPHPILSARLEGVKIDGNRATGTIVRKEGARERRGGVAFVKVGGGWRLDTAPGRPREAPLKREQRK
jgi:hypothetical protein